MLESIRPQMYQYFIESETEGRPFDGSADPYYAQPWGLATETAF